VKVEEKVEKQEKEVKVEKEEKNEPKEEIKVPEVKAPVVEEKTLTPFETKLKQLEEMGFGNRDLNIELLVKNKADLTRTIRDLLEL